MSKNKHSSHKTQRQKEALAQAHPDTLAIRAGFERTDEGEHSEPIFTTSSYVFASAAQAAARFSGDEPGNVYSRYTNPTVHSFEERLAALEGAEKAVATASGMAAILSACMALLQAGDHIVCSRSVFGTTVVLLTNYLAKFGVEISFVSPTAIDQWQQAMQTNTRLLLVETPSNPLNEIVDIAALSQLAHDHNSLLAVDNCFCTPALQQPLALGADLVIHSATKYLDGQGRCVGGAVAGSGQLIDAIHTFLRSGGPSMSPFNAWVFLGGLSTLSLRMQAHSRNALLLAQWLEKQPSITRVYYAGLPSHPQHALAARQQSDFGGVLAFTIDGDRQAAWHFIDAVSLCSLTANLGDVKTTIIHPATTTHGRLSEQQRRQIGITDNLIRLAVGLEHIDDLIEDMQRGLVAAYPRPSIA